MFRRLARPQLAIDLSIAAGFLLLALVTQLARATVADVSVLVIMSIALGMRRLSPALALAIAWVGAILQMSLHAVAPSFSDFAVFAVLFATASYGARALRWIGLASAIVGAFVATGYLIVFPQVAQLLQSAADGGVSSTDAANTVRSSLLLLFGLLISLVLAWTLGLLARTFRLARESRLARALAEREIAVEQERTRIARDMHDVVAHSLAVVIAQADGSRYAKNADPDVVDSALTAISTTARNALADVRVLLTQLRHSEGDAPQPELADLDGLIDQVTASGLSVSRSESGAPASLATGQQLAVYRIVQEALTNALRHGEPSEGARVLFDWRERSVVVSVSSGLRNGQIAANPGGHGIDGMRERAALVGGNFDCGEHGSQFVVTAEIPIDRAVASSVTPTKGAES